MRFPSLAYQNMFVIFLSQAVKVLTFYGIIEAPKEFHSTHTKNLYAPQRFPNWRVCREATKDQSNPLCGK